MSIWDIRKIRWQGTTPATAETAMEQRQIISDYGECEIAVPHDRNGEFEPNVIGKRQTRTDEIEQKIMAM